MRTKTRVTPLLTAVKVRSDSGRMTSDVVLLPRKDRIIMKKVNLPHTVPVNGRTANYAEHEDEIQNMIAQP